MDDWPNSIRPLIECPKCGNPYGFQHSKPTFHITHPMGRQWGDDHTTGEHLDWECGICGYRVESATADHR